MKIGIQGEIGSSNHAIAVEFANQQGWSEYEIVPLQRTRAVLAALQAGRVDYGTFAWESSSGGVVSETREAVRLFSYCVIAEIVVDIEHALLIPKNGVIETGAPVRIYSHPQALREHRHYLADRFPAIDYLEAADTGRSARQLSSGAYPPNSLVIAPPLCAQVYDLDVFQADLPYDGEAWTRFFLVKHKKGI